MADLDIAFRDDPVTAVAYTNTVQAVSPGSTAVGDYILIIADVDYVNPNDLQIQATSGVETWSALPQASANPMAIKAWIARVTTAGAKTVVVSQGSGTSGLHIHLYTLNPSGGDISVDGTPTQITSDLSSPFTHSAVTVSGTKSLLICVHGQVQFSGTASLYGAAPSGMTAVANYGNEFSGMQSCYQTLSSAGSTGTRDQTSVPTSLTSGGGAGMMFALRNEGEEEPDPDEGEPKKFYLSNSSYSLAIDPTNQWNKTDSSQAYVLSETPLGANAVTQDSENVSTSPYDVLLGRWVTEPIRRTGTLKGNGTQLVQLTLAVQESNTNADFVTRFLVYVLTPQDTIRNGVTFLNVAFNTSSEWPTAYTGRGHTVTGTNEIDVLPGDRIVLEAGFRSHNTVTTNYTGALRRGGTGTDLQIGDTGTNAQTRPGHITFLGPVSHLWEEDDDPDPEPGSGTPDIIASDSDWGGGSASSISFSGIQADDLIVAIGTRAYGNSPAEALTYSGVSATVTELGASLGDVPPSSGGNQNMMMRAWALRATSSGTITLTQPASGADSTTVAAVHLRNAANPSDTADAQWRQGSVPSSLPVGPADGLEGALLLGTWSIIDFVGSVSPLPVPSGMTRIEDTGDYFALNVLGTEILTTDGATGTRTISPPMTAAQGAAAKLIVVPGLAVEPEPEGPEPGRFFLVL